MDSFKTMHVKDVVYLLNKISGWKEGSESRTL